MIRLMVSVYWFSLKRREHALGRITMRSQIHAISSVNYGIDCQDRIVAINTLRLRALGLRGLRLSVNRISAGSARFAGVESIAAPVAMRAVHPRCEAALGSSLGWRPGYPKGLPALANVV